MSQDPVRFALLGSVRCWRGRTELDLGRPQQRALLALLLARAGRPVSVSDLVDTLWGQDPPDSAVNVIRRHVGSLRRVLEPALPKRAAGRWLLRGAGGYRLEADADSLDLLRFRRLRDEARWAERGGAAERAVELFSEALALWQGPAGAGIPAEVRAHPVFGALDREHMAAVKEAADLALGAGLADVVLSELQAAAADSPLDEPLLARLVLCLSATGHRAEALEVFQAARARLAEELGIDPGPELRQAQAAALGAGSAVEPSPDPGSAAAVASGPAATGAPGYAVPVPAQLPHDLPVFTGRRAELDEALARMPDGRRPVSTVLITAIGGAAGIGKTTLAVHWAHRVADRFPDGQFYVNLRGFGPTGTAMSAGEAVRGFLDALGVPPERIPNGLDAQTALWRSLLAGRRVLVVLDNARDSEQVRPLLPGSPGCLTVVTSRDRLQGLVAGQGAHTLPLRPLAGEEARELLAGRLGAGRVAAEPEAVAEIARLCDGLPLALACVAARAAVRPGAPLSAIAGELRASRGSLDAFADGDAATDVGTVFSWSYRAVPPDAARLFRLLSLHPGADFSAPATASLAGLPVRRARALLAELARVHLVGEPAPGRYELHDLLRAYSGDLADAHDPPEDRRAAAHRLFDHYAHTAHAADRLIAPHGDPLAPVPAHEGTAPEPLADHAGALAWLTAEHAVLLAAVDAAALLGFDGHACRLAWSLEPFFDRRGHWHDWAASQRTALDAAHRLADPALEARGHRGLARVEGRLGRLAEARTHLERALELFQELGDDTALANTHRSMGWTAEQQGDLGEALGHNERALELFRSTGSRAAQASVLNSVGWYHALLGEYRQALAHCREALPMLQELGDRYGQAGTWHSIGYAQARLGRHPQAVIAYHNALALYRELGVPYLEAVTLTDLGDTRHALGSADSARTAWREALVILTRLGHPDAREAGARLHSRDAERDLA